MSFSYDPEETQKPVPEGNYLCQITRVTDELSSGGNQMLKMVLRIIQNNDTQDESNQGSLLWFYLVDGQYFSQNALRIMESACMDASEKRNIEADTFVDKIVLVEVEHQKKGKYKGNPQITKFLKRSDDLDESELRLANEDNTSFDPEDF